MEVKVAISGRLLETLPRARSISEKHLQDALNRASALVWQRSIERAPASTGTLKKSIQRDLYPTYAQVYPTVQYGLYVHEGTRPHWPPVAETKPGGSIYRWAQKKGIPPFLVARAIARRGTKGQPWLADIAKNDWKEVQEVFINTLDKIIGDLR